MIYLRVVQCVDGGDEEVEGVEGIGFDFGDVGSFGCVHCGLRGEIEGVWFDLSVFIKLSRELGRLAGGA